MIFLYNLILIFFTIAYIPRLIIKKKLHKGFIARAGFINPKITFSDYNKKIIWIHAVSVGEVIAVLPLVSDISEVFSNYNIVFSVVTITGYKVAKDTLKGDIQVIYAPLDFSWAVKRYIRNIHPSLYISAETEIWPNLYIELGKQKIPIIQVNGRISDKSYKGYCRFLFIIKAILKNVTYFCMRDNLDAERIINLGADKNKVVVTGNLKFDSIPDVPDMDKTDLGYSSDSLLLIGGSTHPGEESILVNVFMRLKPKFSKLNLILAPRHMDRINDIMEDVKRMNLRCAKYSEIMSGKNPENKILIVDTIGHLRSLYGVADVVFIGKSLTAKGGQNMIEPIFFGKPTFVGPYTGNFRNIVEKLKKEDILFEISGEEELFSGLYSMFNDPNGRRNISNKAKNVVSSLRGATEKTMKIVEKVLSK